jgi:hypothetical protein
MSFDIQEPVFTPDGEYLEEAAIRYREELMERFVASPEGQELAHQGSAVGWAETFMNLGIDYLGVTPAAITAEQLRTILFELFPRKVSAEPGCGQEIMQELRAFWKFLQREFGLANAGACLRVLTAATARRLDREMQDPAKFGLAKAFLAQGLAHGFDMTTPEGMQAWADTYNAGLHVSADPARALVLPSAGTARRATTTTAARRKLAQRSRRVNRKKR